jgi:hypothetical protein
MFMFRKTDFLRDINLSAKFMIRRFEAEVAGALPDLASPIRKWDLNDYQTWPTSCGETRHLRP